MTPRYEPRPALPAGVPDHVKENGIDYNYRWHWPYAEGLIVVRYDGPKPGSKTFRPYHRAGGQNWKAGIPHGMRPLYGLESLHTAHSETIYIVEGEKCADAVRGLRLPCVAALGGAQSVSKTDWTPLQNFQRATILPDNDSPGGIFGYAVADALASLPGAREVWIANLPGLPEGGDVCDWLQARVVDWDGFNPLPVELVDGLRGDLLGDIEAHAERYTPTGPLPAVAPHDWPDPVPLCSTLDAPAPFPFDSLGPILGPFARALCAHVQAPDAVCAGSVLAGAALGVQGHANVSMPAVGPRPLALFVLSVAESGERKSQVDSEVLAPHREFQKERMQEYRELLREHECTLEAHAGAKRKATAGSKDLSALRATLEALGPPPAAPLNPTLLVNDGTLPGLQRLLREGVSSFGLFSDEAGMFLGGYAGSKDQFMQTIAGLSKFWDGSDHVSAYKGDGLSGFTGRRVSMHLMAQPAVVQKLWSNPMAHGQGFLARCLTAYPLERAGTRTYDGHDFDCPERDTYLDQLARILAAPLPREVEGRAELAPRVLPLSEGAKARLREFQEYLEPHMGTGGEFASVRAFASKTAEQAVRIAAVLALIDRLDIPCVELVCMEHGINLAEFYLHEHLRLAAWEGTRPEVVNAGKLLEWFKAHNLREVDRRHLQQHAPHALRDKAQLDPAIKVLEDHYLLRPLDGKPKAKKWEVRAA